MQAVRKCWRGYFDKSDLGIPAVGTIGAQRAMIVIRHPARSLARHARCEEGCAGCGPPKATFSFVSVNCPPCDSTGRDPRDGSHPSLKENMSPFVPRTKQHDDSQQSQVKKASRKGVTIIDPSSETESRYDSILGRRRRDAHLSLPHGDSPMKHSILRDPHFETHMPNSALGSGVYPSMSNSTSTSTGLSSTLKPGFKPSDKNLTHQWTLGQFYENSMNPSVSTTEESEYARYVDHPLNLPLVTSNESPSVDDPVATEYHEYLCMTEGNTHALRDTDSIYLPELPRLETDASSIYSQQRPMTAQSVTTPFSHAPSYSYPYPHFQPSDPEPQMYPTPGKFQTPEQDIEEFEEFLKVSDNPLNVGDEDGDKKRYKAYRQWLRGKSFFKQSKVDPEWQNQLPVR